MAAAVLAVATTTGVLAWHPWHRGVPPPREPVLSLEQDDTGVRVRIRNVNEHWGLRNQYVRITLRVASGLPTRSYGPDRSVTIDGKPGKELHCCLITSLPPGGEFTFDLFPIRTTVAGFTMRMRGGEQWVRM